MCTLHMELISKKSVTKCFCYSMLITRTLKTWKFIYLSVGIQIQFLNFLQSFWYRNTYIQNTIYQIRILTNQNLFVLYTQIQNECMSHSQQPLPNIFAYLITTAKPAAFFWFFPLKIFLNRLRYIHIQTVTWGLRWNLRQKSPGIATKLTKRETSKNAGRDQEFLETTLQNDLGNPINKVQKIPLT